MNILNELVDAIDQRRAVVCATVIDSRRSVPRRPGSKMLVYADGSLSGTIGGGEMEARVVSECREVIASRQSRCVTYSLLDPGAGDPGVCGGEVELYLEPHMPQTTIYVIGIGHVGTAVIELAGWLGYRVIAWDDRTELTEHVEGAEAILSGTIADAVKAQPIDEFTRVVMVTRNVDLDTQILPVLLETPAPYIGLMGSGRRWETTRARLVAEGASEEALDRVHSPIGIEIAAETPAEIAVSILAEVIGHERGG
jgi:xanthine dehydrogenase accessory factor